jgi:hypothetical protein
MKGRTRTRLLLAAGVLSAGLAQASAHQDASVPDQAELTKQSAGTASLAGTRRLAQDGGDGEEGATPRAAQSGLDLHLGTGRLQPCADPEPERGTGMKKAPKRRGSRNSSRGESLQGRLEVASSLRRVPVAMATLAHAGTE